MFPGFDDVMNQKSPVTFLSIPSTERLGRWKRRRRLLRRKRRRRRKKPKRARRAERVRSFASFPIFFFAAGMQERKVSENGGCKRC